MSSLKLRTKLFITYILAGVIPVVLVSAWSMIHDRSNVEETVKANIAMYQRVISDEVKVRFSAVESAGLLLSYNPLVADLILANDNEALRQMGQQVMKNIPLVSFVVFTDMTGTVIARGHSERAGDSIANQLTWRSAVKGQGVVAVDNGTVVKLSVRGAFPVIKDGVQIGVASLGFSLATNEFVDSIKNLLKVECTIFAEDTRMATTIISQGKRAAGTRLGNPAIEEHVLKNGGTWLDKNTILGQNYDTAYWPIKDADNNSLGMFFIGLPTSAYEAELRQVLVINGVAVVATILVMFLVGWWVSSRVSTPIIKAVESLSTSVTEVSDAAHNIDKACHKLADASGAQSSSLTESSTALEQLSSHSKSNAEHSIQARDLMNQTAKSVKEAEHAIGEMLETMNNIHRSSDQVAGIIKTIEDISFQTNLLALNASVEAARAGEHGMGFAVVAEEVRNLAQRAAEAAGSTDTLISESVAHSRKGEDVARRVSESIAKTVESTMEVAELVDKVEHASNEQSIGIGQISESVTVMERGVNEISATSQSTAQVSHELSEQSDGLEDIMMELAAMVDPNKAEELRQHHARMISGGEAANRPLLK